MSALDTLLTQDGPDDAPSRAEALAHGLIAPQLAMLTRLAEAGVEIAVALKDQAQGPTKKSETEVAVVSADIGLAYDRVARAVRLSLALQSRLVSDLANLERGRAEAAEDARIEREDSAFFKDHARRERVDRIVRRVTLAEHPGGDAYVRLRQEAEENLEDFDRYDDLLSRPFSEIVDVICRDLGLTPDWTLLSQEGWAQRELASGSPGAPLKALGLTAAPRAGPPPPVEAFDRRFEIEVRCKAEIEPEPDHPPPQPPPKPVRGAPTDREVLRACTSILDAAYGKP